MSDDVWIRVQQYVKQYVKDNEKKILEKRPLPPSSKAQDIE